MRIQHNIMAMNAYRNYNINTSALAKNLEKLSSGYKINRAGDDAAGLAISEKMRAQITGLNAATKNVKDGISLVKTAEGAMQEIQDMLNRMDYLATQSANGTYDDPVDRLNLQKEVDALKTEINRIADSANFNGIKLLDGSLSGKSEVSNVAVNTSTAVKGKYTTAADLTATKNLVVANGTGTSLGKNDIGKTIDYTVTWNDANGAKRQTTVSLTFQGTGGDNPTVDTTTAGIANNYFTDANGGKYNLQAAGNLQQSDVLAGIKASLEANEEFNSQFSISTNGNKLVFEARAAGKNGVAQVTDTGASHTFVTSGAGGANGKMDIGGDGTVTVTTKPMDAVQKINNGVLDSKIATSGDTKIEDIMKKVFELNGHKILIADNTFTGEQMRSLSNDINVITLKGAATANFTGSGDDKKLVAGQIQQITGLKTSVAEAANNDASIVVGDILFEGSDVLKLGGRSLTLQIGDTADKFNQMDIKVGDMHVAALGIDGVNISNLEDAQNAIAKIKDAINSVSSVRGDLGAFQNRLEHTQNNLNVMRENIQDAESTIRDTDVAEEMMAYTKNNILIQSAQAMLAQANAVPQGVLQLLG